MSAKRVSILIVAVLVMAGVGVIAAVKRRGPSPQQAEAAVALNQGTSASVPSPADQAPKDRARAATKVFVVHSYENDNVCGANQDAGIVRALNEDFGDSAVLVRHFMDTKTANRSAPRQKQEARRVLARIAEEKPDLVFTVDDNAFREVGLALLGTDTPVVFSGMNGQPANYNKATPFLDDQGRPNANITGVYEKLQLVPSLRVLKMVLPEARQIVVLLDDSNTGKAIRQQLQREIPENDTGIAVDIRMVSTVAEYRRQIQSINEDVQVAGVYNIVLSIRDEQGTSLAAADTFREHLRTCNKPSLALNFTFAKLGLFGGASVDFEDMGYKAGRMACRLLQGQSAGAIPIADAEKVMITFNKTRADALGIEIPPELLTACQLFQNIPLLADQGN